MDKGRAMTNDLIEQIAQQWDGCTYESVGEDIDIGQAIREAGARLALTSPVAPEQVVAWSGWACQYPGKLPRLYGAKEIAELNCDHENGDRLLLLAASPEAAPAAMEGTEAKDRRWLCDRIGHLVLECESWKAKFNSIASHPTSVGEWGIDHSAGRPILVHKACSVIEAEDAEYVLRLINADRAKTAATPADPSASEETVRLFEMAVSNCARLHAEYMGKAMTDKVYDHFATLRDDSIPALRKQLLAALAQPAPVQEAAATPAIPKGDLSKVWQAADDVCEWLNYEVSDKSLSLIKSVEALNEEMGRAEIRSSRAALTRPAPVQPKCRTCNGHGLVGGPLPGGGGYDSQDCPECKGSGAAPVQQDAPAPSMVGDAEVVMDFAMKQWASHWFGPDADEAWIAKALANLPRTTTEKEH